MIINGTKISAQLEKKIQKQAAKFSKPSVLVVFSAGNNPANTSYIQRKKLFAERVGVVLRHVKLPDGSSLAAKKTMEKTLKDVQPDAAILQLPVSPKLDADLLISALPASLDVDALGKGKKQFLSPVILSIQEILQKKHIKIRNKKVVIIGRGRLVGKPALQFFKKHGAKVKVCDEFTRNIPRFTKEADILVSGAGAAHIITADMVSKGVVALDVGFAQKNGKIVGDIHPDVARKASVFSPVPGGIGAMTVAYLFSNVIQAKKH